MQPFYSIFTEEVTQAQVLEKAIEFFFALEGEAKEAFLAQIRAKHGEESYDLLKNYSTSVRNFHELYKQQILENIVPFLPIEQVFELVRLEYQLILQQANPFIAQSYITKTAEFTQIFFKFVKNIEHRKIEGDVMSKYVGYETDVALVHRVEQVLFLQKLYSLCKDICADMSFIWSNLMGKTKSLEKVSYWLPDLQISLGVLYIEYDSEGGHWNSQFKPEELQDILGGVQNVVQKNTLPAIEGVFKDYLTERIAQYTLQQDYQQQSMAQAYAPAQHDIQNILANYPEKYQYWGSIKFKSTLQLHVGELRATISSSIYRDKVNDIVFSALFAIVVWGGIIGVLGYSERFIGVYLMGLVFAGVSISQIYNFFQQNE